jgi:hypothetical protein
MAPRPVRTFASEAKVSPKIVLGAVAAALGVVVTAGVAAHANTNAEEGEAAQAAKKILHAANTYSASSAQPGCPTITELVETRALEESARTEDAWGNRFRIVCDGANPRVVSAGPDGHVGTRDDVRFAQ